MPFTVSHAVVALAARRLPVPVAAVAVGSMAPDAVLFAPVLPPYEAAHSWWGIPTIDLAVSLVVLATWWFLVRPAWAPVVPGVRDRVPRAWWSRPTLDVRTVLVVVLACVAGSVTHVVWDGFTHGHGFVVQAWPALRETSIGGYWLPFFLQDASSVLGLAALLVAAAVWWRRTAAVPTAVPSRAERVVVVVVAAAVLPATATQAGKVLLQGGGVGGVVVALSFRVPVFVALGLVLGAVVLLVVRGRTERRADAPERRSGTAEPHTGAPAVHVVTGRVSPPRTTGALWVEVDGSACTTKDGILAEFSRALAFPGYFGHNWDAFDECVHDLDWLGVDAVVVHLVRARDVGRDDPESRRVLQDVLGRPDAEYAPGFLTVWFDPRGARS
ncbi:DUF4184 family protein [Curtobacterium sp. BH-2-1-1]|uniref:DUF4184 family protein n=1 Tax=Curtobacterium sp. BH-2-1-1 TaxID=1905847 RepID=UPI0011A53D31|nr:DUF4184 family protein [Curtobacterium sp. BH-2-1-1]